PAGTGDAEAITLRQAADGVDAIAYFVGTAPCIVSLVAHLAALEQADLIHGPAVELRLNPVGAPKRNPHVVVLAPPDRFVQLPVSAAFRQEGKRANDAGAGQPADRHVIHPDRVPWARRLAVP